MLRPGLRTGQGVPPGCQEASQKSVLGGPEALQGRHDARQGGSQRPEEACQEDFLSVLGAQKARQEGFLVSERRLGSPDDLPEGRPDVRRPVRGPCKAAKTPVREAVRGPKRPDPRNCRRFQACQVGPQPGATQRNPAGN